MMHSVRNMSLALLAMSAGAIGVFSIQSNGTLHQNESISGLPKTSGVNGLAAY